MYIELENILQKGRKKRMRTLEVLKRVIAGKQLAFESKRKLTHIFSELAKYSEEFPEKGVTINEWLNTLLVADITKRLYFAWLNSAGKYMKKHYDLSNPCDTADLPKWKKRQRRYWTPEEEMRIIASCKYGYDRELILTLADSLCRIGGLSGLEGKDVQDGFIIVKEKTGQRRYRLDSRICFALKKLAGSDDGFVFANKDGGQETVLNLRNRVRRVVARAGITGEKKGAHTFRHSGASIVAKEFRNVMIIQTLLQHDKPESSMEYIHDIDIEIQKDISPLRLIAEKAYNGQGNFTPEFKQLTMPGSTEVKPESEAETNLTIAEPVPNYYDDMFPEVADGVEIRPLLKAEDLRLIRQAFITHAQNGNSHADMLKARELMKRILRKAGTRGGNHE